MKLKEALGIRSKEVICLVGGGGKTTLLFALAKELADGDSCVVTTTTTKILEPSLAETEELILEKDPVAVLSRIRQGSGKYRLITVAREKLANGKLDGVAPDTVVSLAELETVSHVIIEADGAAQHPLKAPAGREPVIPPNTSLVLAVAGLDALGGKLEEVVFRAEIAANLLRVPPETAVTPELMARLITHHQGITKGSPAAARIVPFLNKADINGGLVKGGQVARAILADPSQIDIVLLGQAQHAEPVIEVIHRGE